MVRKKKIRGINICEIMPLKLNNKSSEEINVVNMIMIINVIIGFIKGVLSNFLFSNILIDKVVKNRVNIKTNIGVVAINPIKKNPSLPW